MNRCQGKPLGPHLARGLSPSATTARPPRWAQLKSLLALLPTPERGTVSADRSGRWGLEDLEGGPEAEPARVSRRDSCAQRNLQGLTTPAATLVGRRPVRSTSRSGPAMQAVRARVHPQTPRMSDGPRASTTAAEPLRMAPQLRSLAAVRVPGIMIGAQVEPRATSDVPTWAQTRHHWGL